ncbi:flagellar protein I-like protein [Aeropyrum camini SY1 = JCM 12091]|uniref:Flagellar protein I-like protein n=1 Tax=Aeropyrum camini SY1 = JCM 12091 TaxID=1198449 RepID=U3TFB6_9CREN|nr:type II/IV secretion system ATPase subunit [Aeropyrum camini]BAN90663.1 flagellar protein I-like protein [Aeropyrum camini SY1 = JCM 12091]
MSFLRVFGRRRGRGLRDIEVSEPEFGDRPEYLEEYIRRFTSDTGREEPELVEKIPSTMKNAREFNVVYPVGFGIFIHAYNDPLSESGYNKYVVVEPPKPPEDLVRLIDYRIAFVLSEEDAPRSSQEKKRILLAALDKVVTVTSTENLGGGDGGNGSWQYAVKRGRIVVPEKYYNYLKYHFIREKVGVGPLEPFLRDPYLEDISCNGVGPVYVVHKMFRSLESSIRFESESELDDFILKLGEKIGKPISHARPVVDATLPDGSRINIVFGSDVSLKGSNFTIRKVSKIPISVTQLIKWGTFDARIAAYMWMMLEEGMSVFICGETASGKTTSLNAISVFIRPDAKIVTIEDTAEVVLPHPNWTRELTRNTGKPETSVTMFDLLRAALRQRPNYIIVGEIRGAEGNIAFQAMQTGHPVMATFHAANLSRLLQRLTNHPINVPKTNIDSLNIAWFQSAVHVKGFPARRVLEIDEIIGYDPSSGAIAAVPSFTWDPVRDKFIFSGRGASYLLEEKIATMKGIPRRELSIIYEELELRRRFLQTLVDKNILDYFDVYKAIVRAYNIGVEEALKRLERDELLD